jgi:hypothetical protein
MPRERIQRSVTCRVIDSGLDFEIRQQGAAVWIALFGILDRPRLVQLRRSLSPQLRRRGLRIVLDGRRLHHIDYRVVRELLAWNRQLRALDHRLFLFRWSNYLQAILSMEDWDRELAADSSKTPEWVADQQLVLEQLP